MSRESTVKTSDSFRVILIFMFPGFGGCRLEDTRIKHLNIVVV